MALVDATTHSFLRMEIASSVLKDSRAVCFVQKTKLKNAWTFIILRMETATNAKTYLVRVLFALQINFLAVKSVITSMNRAVELLMTRSFSSSLKFLHLSHRALDSNNFKFGGTSDSLT